MTTTNGDILTLAQWLSPSFPVGAFAYSHGLEMAIADGVIGTAGEMQDWLTDVVRNGSGRNDCILLRAAYVCADREALDMVNAYGLANASSAERRMESERQGAAFTKTVADIWDGDAPEHLFPVAVGAAAARLNLDPTLTASMYLHAFVSNLVSASVRAVPLGQTEGQAVLAALAPLCTKIADDTALSSLDDIQSTAFLSDIAAMRHETLQPRIFRS